VQASSGLFFDVFTRYDPGNLLVSQAHREVLERQLESSRLGRTLERLASSRVVITEPPRTPPLAFPLLVDRTRNRVSSETLADRIRRMQVALERYADQGNRTPPRATGWRRPRWRAACRWSGRWTCWRSTW
jgi:ATP-dependent Lhr-like helicase